MHEPLWVQPPLVDQDSAGAVSDRQISQPVLSSAWSLVHVMVELVVTATPDGPLAPLYTVLSTVKESKSVSVLNAVAVIQPDCSGVSVHDMELPYDEG
jgi:hypothetical protein